MSAAPSVCLLEVVQTLMELDRSFKTRGPDSVERGRRREQGQPVCQSIGTAIRQCRLGFRQGEGLSQEKLAERIGKTREYVSRLEAGVHPQPSLGLLLLIARALELSEAETNSLLLACGHDELPSLIPVDRPTASAFLR